MNIGIDIDGVLVEYFPSVLKNGIKVCKQLKKFKLIDKNQYDVRDIFDWDLETVKFYVDNYELKRMSKPALKNASKITHQLHEQGHKLFIVTSREVNDLFYPSNNGIPFIEFTESWLKTNNIYFDKLCFGSVTKSKTCKEHKIDVMIEDAPGHLRDLAGATNIIVFDSRYNRLDEFNGMKRAKNWKQVSKVISELQKDTLN